MKLECGLATKNSKADTLGILKLILAKGLHCL